MTLQLMKIELQKNFKNAYVWCILVGFGGYILKFNLSLYYINLLLKKTGLPTIENSIYLRNGGNSIVTDYKAKF